MASTSSQPDLEESENTGDARAASFQALEQRILRAIDLLRQERELRTSAEQRAATAEARWHELTRQFEEQAAQIARHTAREAEQSEQGKRLEAEVDQLTAERDQVRLRVERLLHHLDEFTGA